MPELDIELWAVTEIDISGVPHIAVTSSRDQAISHFFQMTYLFVHAAPEQKFRVIGDDDDAALTGLHLIWDHEAGALCVASLTRPGSIGSQPGWAPVERAKKEFTEIAAEVQAALDLTAGKLAPNEVERLSFSSAAVALGRELAEEMLANERSADIKPVTPARAKKIWAEMAGVRQYVQMMARIVGNDPKGPR